VILSVIQSSPICSNPDFVDGHQIDLENVEIVDRSSVWKQRLILEAWHSVRDKNTINEHIALPNVYNGIKNFETH